jgi:uncharacterized damage-inducible protein DinB
MTEKDRIRDQIERAFDGDPWCGPSLIAILNGVDYNQAAKRVDGLTHSIWENVLHLAAWQGTVASRVAGNPTSEPEDGDWPAVGDVSETTWKACLDRLDRTHRDVLKALDGLDETLLERRIGDNRDPAFGSGMTAYANLQGIAQHGMYHAGQIAMLKKLTAAR